MSEELHPLPCWPAFRQTAPDPDSPACVPMDAAAISQVNGSVFLPTIITSKSAMERQEEDSPTKLADVLPGADSFEAADHKD